jgi:hypothetical protein
MKLVAVAPVTANTVRDAMTIGLRYGLSHWDSLIVAAAPRKKMPQRRLTPYEAALKVGLIGCIDGPTDLAENRRKYIRQDLCVRYRSH